MGIKDLILQKGVTMIHVAKMVGIDPKTLSRICNGKKQAVSAQTMARIHKYLAAINTDDETILK